MTLDITKQKEKAIAIMKRMDIYTPYITGFQEQHNVCYFEEYGGYWVFQDRELMAKINAIENRYKCLVYAVTHEFTEFGECYSLLIVTAYPEEWATLVQSKGNKHVAFAYVWNKDDDECSEFGTAMVHSFGGGIRRIA